MLAIKLLRTSAFRCEVKNETSPSANLSTTLPTKPSQTTTSTLPWKRSLPSTLPMKLSSLSESIFQVWLQFSVPLPSSEPMLSRPTLGVRRPMISRQ